MKSEIDPKWFSVVCNALIQSGDKTATKYLSPKLVVRATWQHKPLKNNTREEILVTYGAPNYQEVEAIALMNLAGEPFPVKRVQFRTWPIKRKQNGVK